MNSKFSRWKKRPRPRKELDGVQAPKTAKLTVELLNPNQLNVEVQLPERGELETFTKILMWLNQGKMMPNIRYALEHSESPRGEIILKAMELVDTAEEDEPVICPTKAIMYNIRRNNG
jgi:5,10-methenyltetrahydromethanopterin hydrogenase